MEVLESITNYVESMKGNNYIYDNHKHVLDMLYQYFHHMEPQLSVSAIEWDFFDEFLMYWLPKKQRRLKEKEVYQVLSGVRGYCQYIQEIYHVQDLSQREVKQAYKKEYLRIYHLKQLFYRYLSDPVLNIEPFIVDFKMYKKYKIRKDVKQPHGVYQQGLFQVIEIDYDQTAVLSRLSKGNSVRVVFIDLLIDYLRTGDILHLRIKQKQFFACWEVVGFTNAYLSNACQYLTN